MTVLLRIAARVRLVVWRVFGPRTVGVRGLVVDAEGRVLLVRHTYGPSTWHLPGGGVKRRETIEAAARRELREEAGVVCTGALALLGVYSNVRGGKSDHISVLVATEWECERDPHDSAEIAAAEWFAPDDLPDDATPATRRRVAEWRAGSRGLIDAW
ncbi:MAG TPA: NUDIX domain-containing protein [Acidimicrobiales bacterium]|nr:NUDIX domain-containing protein [Acidimicrobiales bacterium]